MYMCIRIWYLSFFFWLTSLCIIDSKFIHLIRTDSNVFLCLQCGRPEFDPWIGKIPWKRKWQPTPVLLPGKSHGWRSLVGCSPRGCKESDTSERQHEYSIVYMYHNYFVNSSVNGYLGCFYFLAIVNSAAMNNGVLVTFSTLVSSGVGNP